MVIQKISVFDPECNTISNDVEFLGDLFDNIIGAKEYDLLLSELKDWEFEKSNDATIRKGYSTKIQELKS